MAATVEGLHVVLNAQCSMSRPPSQGDDDNDLLLGVGLGILLLCAAWLCADWLNLPSLIAVRSLLVVLGGIQ